MGGDSGSVNILDGRTGAVLSSYHTFGVIGSSPAVWNGKMYVGSGDGSVYAFDDKQILPMGISATIDKGSQILSGETITLSGRLNTSQRFFVEAEPTLGSGQIDEWYYPGIPSAKLSVLLTNPNQASVTLNATTDSKGFFNVSYSPNVAGNWTYSVWYPGQEFPGDGFSYSAIQSDTKTLEVTAPVTPTPSPSIGPQSQIGYSTIAVIIIIAIAAIAIGAYA